MRAKGQILKTASAGLIALSLARVSLAAADPCDPKFAPAVVHGYVTNPVLREISGITASRLNPGVFYVHNDSGNGPQVYAINTQGQHLATINVGTWGARDWEDITVGPGPVDGVNYLYVGEMGDNYAQWPKYYVLRMPEPQVNSTQPAVTNTINNYDVLTYVFPDGPRDAETLMVDPLTKDIFIVSKRETPVRLYRMPYPQATTGTNVLQFIGTINASWAVGGDISASGYEILVKEPSRVLHWCRQAGQTIGQAMTNSNPKVLPCATEPQGESVTWTLDGNGYYTISEGTSQPLYFYARTNQTSSGGSTNPPPASTNQPPVTNPPPATGSGGYTEHDYNGDGVADIGVFWGAGNNWYLQQSGSNTVAIANWGDKNATPTPGDYNGDGIADLATYNPANGVWKMRLTSNETVSVQYGWSATKPVAADYDGDGVTDIAVYHPQSGTWYLMMTTAGFQTRQFGWSEARPVPADYDGDGKADLAVYHPQTGNWYIRYSSDNQLLIKQFGWSAALPIPADYDGDGKADIAVYHPQSGTWYLNRSSLGLKTQQFGWSAAVPVPADYNGDGVADIAVYHQALGDWYVQPSGSSFYKKNFGWSAAEPVTASATILLKH